MTAEPTPEYVHTGEIVSLVCDLKVKTEAELESVKWYIGSEEVLAVGLDERLDLMGVLRQLNVKISFHGRGLHRHFALALPILAAPPLVPLCG